jgi:hypothetical protein
MPSSVIRHASSEGKAEKGEGRERGDGKGGRKHFSFALATDDLPWRLRRPPTAGFDLAFIGF